jgi:hypothetical protein
MDSVIGVFALVLTIFASYPIIGKIFRNEDFFTVLIITFVIGLSTILLPLYIVGIWGSGIAVTSWIIFIASVVLTLANGKMYCLKIFEYARKLRGYLATIGPLEIAFVAAIVFLLVRYVFMLSIKGIFDWDAIDQYLPFGRRIFETNRIPVSAYDYEPIIGPSGISVLYSWLFSIGGNQYDGSFRLIPIIFVTITMAIIYVLGRDFGSKRVAEVAVIIFAFLPLHDAVLYYASYYPDLCYCSLVLAMFFLFYRGFVKQKSVYYLIGGLTFGLSMLMKLQTVYFLPAILLVFIILIKNKYLRLTLTYVSTLLLFFIFISVVWPDPKFFFSLPIVFQGLGLGTILGAATLGLLLLENYIKITQIQQFSLVHVLARVGLFFGIAIPIAIIWPLRNASLTGSLVWSINISAPNRSWALGFLSFGNVGGQNSMVTFLLSIILIPFTVYVLGNLWLIPKLVGLVKNICAKNRSVLLILWCFGYWMGYFLSVFHHFEIYSLNPRDFYVYAPFLSFFAATGLIFIVERFAKRYSNSLLLYLICSFGLFSLSESLLMSNYGSIALRKIVSVLQLPEFTTTVVSLSWRLILIAIAFIVSAVIIGLPLLIRARTRNVIRKILPVVLMFLLLIAPYLYVTYEFSDGNIYAFGEDQLKPIYQGLFTDVAPYLNEHANNGDVVLMVDFYGLQYYLNENVTVVALNRASNLAEFRIAVESKNSTIVLSTLRELGVSYFLARKESSALADKLSNSSILLDIVQDPRYFVLEKSFASWNLYKRVGGGISIAQGWIDDSFTNWTSSNTPNNCTFSSDGEIFTINLAANTRVDLKYAEMPRINTTEYPFIAYRISGTSNARWQVRLYAQNGQIGSDFPSWQEPSKLWSTSILSSSGTPIDNHFLDPSVILSVRSIDNKSATFSIDYYMIFRYDFTQ